MTVTVCTCESKIKKDIYVYCFAKSWSIFHLEPLYLDDCRKTVFSSRVAVAQEKDGDRTFKSDLRQKKALDICATNGRIHHGCSPRRSPGDCELC